jgi:HK97 gp10 family phage protein
VNFGFNISGFPELYRDFEKLDYSRQEKVLVRTARAMAEPIRVRAGELAPILTGRLRRNQIISGAGQRNDANSVTVLIGPSTKAFWGLFVETGLGPGDPQPFLGPAFLQEETRAIEVGAGILSGEINRAMIGGKR